jgi:hypothetical protein
MQVSLFIGKEKPLAYEQEKVREKTETNCKNSEGEEAVEKKGYIEMKTRIE